MRIEKVNISGYGKLNNLEIEFFDGLNIIYGCNEAGKSTIQSFIKAMLYGQRKGKINGWSEKEKFRPWQGGAYSGTFEYSLNNDEKYRIWRDFEINQVKVYNSGLKDITDNFQTNRTMGTLFAQEHLGIDQELFESTCFAAQLAVRHIESGQASIAERVRSIIETGSERASYVSARKLLEKVLNEEIGTERTGQRPLNKIKEKIEKLKERKKLCEGEQQRIHSLGKGLKELKEIEEQNRYQSTKKVNEQAESLKNELERKIIELGKVNAEIPDGVSIFDDEVAKSLTQINEKIKDVAGRKKIMSYISGVFMISGIGTILALPEFWPWGAAICLAGIGIWLMKECTDLKELKGEENDILATARVRNIEQYFNKKNEILLIAEKRKIIEESINLIKDQIAVLNEKESYERIRDIRLKINELETEIRVLSGKSEELPSIEEELKCAYDEKKKLEEFQYCIRKSIVIMQECSDEIKNEVMPRMKRETDRIAKTLTGLYDNIGIDTESQGVVVSSKKGEVIPVLHMSGGTIDQLYLALRLSLCSLLSKKGETLPIIFDEIFALFDEKRLMKAIDLIKEICNEKQVIIFTCKKNETSAMKKIIPNANLINI